MSNDMEEAINDTFQKGILIGRKMMNPLGSWDTSEVVKFAFEGGAQWQASQPNQGGWNFDMDKAPRKNQEIYAWTGSEVIRTMWAKAPHVPLYGWIDFASNDGDGCDLLPVDERPIAWMPYNFPNPPTKE